MQGLTAMQVKILEMLKEDNTCAPLHTENSSYKLVQGCMEIRNLREFSCTQPPEAPVTR